VEAAWQVVDPIHFTVWSRPVLDRFVRGAIDTLFVDEPDSFDGPAPTSDEALEGLRRMFREGYDTYRFKESDFAYGVEAIAGEQRQRGVDECLAHPGGADRSRRRRRR